MHNAKLVKALQPETRVRKHFNNVGFCEAFEAFVAPQSRKLPQRVLAVL